jgi:esterase/lipase superfamily enzyme
MGKSDPKQLLTAAKKRRLERYIRRAIRKRYVRGVVVATVVTFFVVSSFWLGIFTSYRATHGHKIEPKASLAEDQSPAPGGLYRVWFGTNRRPVDEADESKGYTCEPDEQTHFGYVDVNVPKTHRIGETGRNVLVRLARLNLQDDHLSVDNICPLESNEMWTEIRNQMERAKSVSAAPCGLVFIHGYNTSFSDAAIRTAQIGFDLKVIGATAFFSWPSFAMTSAYKADTEAIEDSEAEIAQFLIDFTKRSGATKVHLIAHSMGNLGLLRALQQIATNAETKGGVRFGQIFLAAPDVRQSQFLRLAHLYPQFAQRTTLYESHADWALYMSSQINKAPRAGYFLPYTVASEIDTVAVPNFDVDLLGHSYFAKAGALLADMHDLMETNAEPASRMRIEPLKYGSKSLWELRR